MNDQISEAEASGSQRWGLGMSIGCPWHTKGHGVLPVETSPYPDGMLWRIYIDTVNHKIGVVRIGCDQGDLVYSRNHRERNLRCPGGLDQIDLIGQGAAQNMDIETISFPEGVQIRKQLRLKEPEAARNTV